jgi:glutathione S-transferase
MEVQVLKIYGRPNSLNVRKVLWLCAEIGLDYERTDWGRDYRPTTDPEFMRVSIYGVVPVIDDDGFILRESNSIVRYLASKHGRADLYPTDARARATVEQWMDYGSGDLGKGMPAVFQGKVLGLKPYTAPEIIAWGAADWNKQMSRLDTHFKANGPYIAGAGFTIGDIPVGLMVHRWSVIDFEKPELPALAAYYKRLCERKAFRLHGCNGMP